MPNSEEINWIKRGIDKGFLKHYEYEHFSDVQEIGSGGFGKVYRANWKNSKCLALKSFSALNNSSFRKSEKLLHSFTSFPFFRMDKILFCP